MVKVCIVAPVHRWDDVRVFSKEAVSLAEAGYDVTLIARISNKLTCNGVKIVPVNCNYKTRLSRFVSLPLVFIQALSTKSDIYHLHNPDTLPIAVLLKLFKRKVIYDSHEDYSKRILVRNWIPLALRKTIASLVSFAEIIIAKIVDAIIVTQKNVVDRLGAKAVLIGNPPIITNSSIERSYNTDFTRLIYIGGISLERGLIDMITLMDIVNQSLNARLWLIGEMSTQDQAIVSKLNGWRYVDYLGKLKQEDAFSYLKQSDLGLVLIHDVADHAFTDPNKIYEYSTYGVPFIASHFDLWIDKFKNFDCGWFVPPANPAYAAKVVVDAISDKTVLKTKSDSALEFVKVYNWDVEKIKLLTIYSNLSE